VAWPAPQARTFLDGVPAEAGDWVGSLIKDQRDASGLLYRRNRYYDPYTGQFTQEDPIGVAGGFNLYGFAGGDPVNYSDPFGLCRYPGDPDCAKWMALGTTIGAGAGAVVAAGCTAGTGGICVAGAPVIVGASAGLGYSIGGLAAAVDAANLGEATAELAVSTVNSVMSTLRKWGNTLAGKLLLDAGRIHGQLQGEDFIEKPVPTIEETRERKPKPPIEPDPPEQER
jgi:RHS repeat-associated protein